MEKPQLHIEKPCLEDWNKMSPNQTGRHCQLCDKTVVDFTQMSPEEISNYLTKKARSESVDAFGHQLIYTKKKHQKINGGSIDCIIELRMVFGLNPLGCPYLEP